MAHATASRRIALGQNAAPPRGVDRVAAPVRVQLVRLPADISAAQAACATLALHGGAISRNLECVLTALDPEGPHQLRIALRRTRVALRVFEPVMRRKVNARLVETARTLGRIAGELRDADVMIDEIVAPAARHEPDLLAALNAWRQEVRGRVRAKLLAGDAPTIAAEFTSAAARNAWVKRSRAPADCLFTSLTDDALHAYSEKAAPLAARLPDLLGPELHQLRKAVKAVRYGAELAASAGRPGDIVPRLKRIQDALGYVNDTAALEAFDPPVPAEAPALRLLRERLIEERKHAGADAIAKAMREWRALSGEACRGRSG